MAVLNHLLLRGKGGGRGKGGEMTQILYAHMNKRKRKTSHLAKAILADQLYRWMHEQALPRSAELSLDY
jgi:hypothetical protein